MTTTPDWPPLTAEQQKHDVLRILVALHDAQSPHTRLAFDQANLGIPSESRGGYCLSLAAHLVSVGRPQLTRWALEKASTLGHEHTLGQVADNLDEQDIHDDTQDIDDMWGLEKDIALHHERTLSQVAEALVVQDAALLHEHPIQMYAFWQHWGKVIGVEKNGYSIEFVVGKMVYTTTVTPVTYWTWRNAIPQLTWPNDAKAAERWHTFADKQLACYMGAPHARMYWMGRLESQEQAMLWLDRGAWEAVRAWMDQQQDVRVTCDVLQGVAKNLSYLAQTINMMKCGNGRGRLFDEGEGRHEAWEDHHKACKPEWRALLIKTINDARLPDSHRQELILAWMPHAVWLGQTWHHAIERHVPQASAEELTLRMLATSKDNHGTFKKRFLRCVDKGSDMVQVLLRGSTMKRKHLWDGSCDQSCLRFLVEQGYLTVKHLDVLGPTAEDIRELFRYCSLDEENHVRRPIKVWQELRCIAETLALEKATGPAVTKSPAPTRI